MDQRLVYTCIARYLHYKQVRALLFVCLFFLSYVMYGQYLDNLGDLVDVRPYPSYLFVAISFGKCPIKIKQVFLFLVIESVPAKVKC